MLEKKKYVIYDFVLTLNDKIMIIRNARCEL